MQWTINDKMKLSKTAKLHEVFFLFNDPKWCKMLILLIAHLWIRILFYIAHIYIFNGLCAPGPLMHKICNAFLFYFILNENQFTDITQKNAHSQKFCEKEHSEKLKKRAREKYMHFDLHAKFVLNYEHKCD